MDPHRLARQPMDRSALVATLPSIGPVAREDKEDTQLQTSSHTLPPLIRVQGPDPECVRLFQEALLRAEAALPLFGLQTTQQESTASSPSLTSFRVQSNTRSMSSFLIV